MIWNSLFELLTKCPKKIWIISVITLSLTLSVNVHAYQLGGVSQVQISVASGTVQSGGTAPTVTYTGSYVQLDYPKGYSNVVSLRLSSTIPAHSILNITYTVQGSDNVGSIYQPIACSTACVTLSQSETVTGNSVTGSMLIYSNQTLSTLQLSNPYRVNTSVIYRFGTNVNYAIIPYDAAPGESADLSSIEAFLKSIDQNLLISAQRLQSILDAINKLSNNATSSDIQQVVDSQNKTNDLIEQQQKQDQEDRDNMESTTGDAQDAAEVAQDDLNKSTSNLVNIVGSVVAAIRDTQPTNCKVKADLGSIDLGEMDYCSGRPDAFIPIINIATTLTIVPIAWIWGKHYLADIVSVFESFTGTAMGDFD